MAAVISPRDLALLAMLARGYTTDRAARELRLSRHTVGELISELLGRFGCQNRAELVAYSYVHEVLPVGVWPPACPVGGHGPSFRRTHATPLTGEVSHV